MANIELNLDPIRPRRGETDAQALLRHMEATTCKCGAWTPLRRKGTKEPVCKDCLDVGEPDVEGV